MADISLETTTKEQLGVRLSQQSIVLRLTPYEAHLLRQLVERENSIAMHEAPVSTRRIVLSNMLLGLGSMLRLVRS